MTTESAIGNPSNRRTFLAMSGLFATSGCLGLDLDRDHELQADVPEDSEYVETVEIEYNGLFIEQARGFAVTFRDSTYHTPEFAILFANGEQIDASRLLTGEKQDYLAVNGAIQLEHSYELGVATGGSTEGSLTGDRHRGGQLEERVQLSLTSSKNAGEEAGSQ